MNGIFITQNDDYELSPHDWLVTEYRGARLMYTRRAFETVREAQSWAIEMAVTLIKDLELTNLPPEVIFMDGDAFDAARREFLTEVTDRSVSHTEFLVDAQLPPLHLERSPQYIHLDFELQLKNRLKDAPLAIRMNDLLKLYRGTGQMLNQIDQDYRLALARANEVEQRVDATDDRTRRTAEVERHLIEVFTFLAPAILEAWDELAEPETEEEAK